MRPGDDVSRNEPITDPLTGVSPGTHGSIHSAGLSAHHHGHITTTDVLTTDERDLCSLGHRISGLDGRHHATRLDHAQSDALDGLGRG